MRAWGRRDGVPARDVPRTTPAVRPAAWLVCARPAGPAVEGRNERRRAVGDTAGRAQWDCLEVRITHDFLLVSTDRKFAPAMRRPSAHTGVASTAKRWAGVGPQLHQIDSGGTNFGVSPGNRIDLPTAPIRPPAQATASRRSNQDSEILLKSRPATVRSANSPPCQYDLLFRPSLARTSMMWGPRRRIGCVVGEDPFIKVFLPVLLRALEVLVVLLGRLRFRQLVWGIALEQLAFRRKVHAIPREAERFPRWSCAVDMAPAARKSLPSPTASKRPRPLSSGAVSRS